MYETPPKVVSILDDRANGRSMKECRADFLDGKAGPEIATDDDRGLPKEISTAEASRILGVSKDTVLKLKQSGLLEYRNMASPSSSRPIYAFTLRSVIELRTTYERDQPILRRPEDPPRRAAKGERKYKHLNLDD